MEGEAGCGEGGGVGYEGAALVHINIDIDRYMIDLWSVGYLPALSKSHAGSVDGELLVVDVTTVSVHSNFPYSLVSTIFRQACVAGWNCQSGCTQSERFIHQPCPANHPHPLGI